MNPPILQARGLRKRYASREVVQGIALDLIPGEILALLGPNGAGKSTTVGMICGLIQPDAGEILLRGQAVTRDSMQLRRTIGLVPQDLALFEVLNARQNLEAFGRLQGLSGAALRQRVGAALDVAGLADRAGDPIRTFSGGMKRRLNIAAALLHEPSVLILDEPTVGVDPQSRNAIFQTLEQLRDAGHALLYSTHYMEEAERLCRRVVILDQGQVLTQGVLDQLLAGMDMQAELTLITNGELTPDAMEALRKHPCAQGLQSEGNTLKIGLHSLQDVPALLGHAQQLGLQWRELRSQRASLESLFLQLTGHALRD